MNRRKKHAQLSEFWRRFRKNKAAVLGLIPGAVGHVLAQIPIFDVGIPAITGFYFDWFTSCMQAFIFSMLTIMYIAQEAGDE